MYTRRDIPKVDEVLKNEEILQLLEKYDNKYITDLIRETLDDLRANYKEEDETFDPTINSVVSAIKQKLDMKSKITTVVNATGVVLHTNLGRSILSDDIIDEIRRVATNYSNLEFDLSTGKRGSRYDHLTEYFRKLTGAEDVHIVNNNAAATLLVLNTMADGKEVVVSRGELVEIGGSFRIPDIMKLSGCQLHEIGTTNRTSIDDYRNAINAETALLMKVHQSNYYISGFTAEASSAEIAAIAREHNIPFYEDLGSGALAPLEFNDVKETFQEKFDSGVDIISISGDKLLGGPQAGIILGKKKYIERMKKNQYTRAFRVCKLTLSALEATLKKYIKREYDSIPTINMLKRPKGEIKEATELLKRKLDELGVLSKVVSYNSIVGGGSLPKVQLDSYRLEISVDNATTFYQKLRSYKIPIICIIHDDKLCLDVRCVRDGEIDIIVDAIRSII